MLTSDERSQSLPTACKTRWVPMISALVLQSSCPTSTRWAQPMSGMSSRMVLEGFRYVGCAFSVSLDDQRTVLQIGWSYTPASKSLTIDDFELITVIGKGSFGKVRIVIFVQGSLLMSV